MRALLDVNMLLALFDPGHTFHARAQNWWAANERHGWASCPLTENGFLRIICQPSYARPVSFPNARHLLRNWAVPPRHVFWPDDISLLDTTVIDPARPLGPKQLTDVYLLALAVRHGGRLITLDRRISITSVRGATGEHLATP